MKAEITNVYYGFKWNIKAANGVVVAMSYVYSRRDNAVRGLRNFVGKMWTTKGIEKIMDSV